MWLLELTPRRQQIQQTRVPERFAMPEAEAWSSRPWSPLSPEATNLVSEVDDTPWVRMVVHSLRDIRADRFGSIRFSVDEKQTFVFQRHAWPYGGYVTTVQCQGTCNAHHEAGGSAGERKLELWASRHRCPILPTLFEVDEDTRLFRD